MAWSKKHEHRKPFKTVRCIDPVGCRFLNWSKYGVLEEDETRYLIQFRGRSAKWYAKDRFEDIVIDVAPDVDDTLFNNLF